MLQPRHLAISIVAALSLTFAARAQDASNPSAEGGNPVADATEPLSVAAAPDLTTNPPSSRPRIHPGLPNIFIAGDSTAARGSGTNQQGWAVTFAGYFDPAKVNVINRARGGRSSRTFITEGLWDQLLAEVKTGDIVLIQFGHNDGGPINDERRARGSIRGLGEETEEIDNLVTKKHETIHTFGWYLRRMIADVRAKDARPIVLSLTVRNIWKESKVERGSGRYSQWARDIADTAGVPFVDLTEVMADQFDGMGEEEVGRLYPRDHTHFNAGGADLHAAAVVALLKGLQPNPVAGLLSARGRAVQAKTSTRE